MTEKQISLLKTVRQALLMIVDGIEEALELERTSTMRKRLKEMTLELEHLKACQKTEI
ncbi:MAG TPA: hypothetical protein VIY48_13035 [Candidatus Paceibacterota bacterium]